MTNAALMAAASAPAFWRGDVCGKSLPPMFVCAIADRAAAVWMDTLCEPGGFKDGCGRVAAGRQERDSEGA